MTKGTTDPIPAGLSTEERARLARKGEILWAKSCGPGGRGDCVESFARHQARLGRRAVVDDLLKFLEDRIEALRSADPGGRRPSTEALAARIRRHLDDRSAPGTGLGRSDAR